MNRLSQGLNKNNFFIVLIYRLAAAVFAGFLLASTGFTAETPYEKYCDSGLKLLNKNMYDSSLIQFQHAVKNGLPHDRMFYFFAQVYLEKGALDTALALNLSSQPLNKTSRIQLLSQRQIIYSTLGLKKEEQSIADSIAMEGAVFTASRLIPDISFSVRAGIYRLEELRSLMQIAELEPPLYTESKSTSPNAGGLLDIRWWMSAGRFCRWYLGAAGRADKIRFLRPIKLDATLKDSVSVMAGVKTGLHFHSRLQIDGELSRLRDSYGRTFTYAKTWINASVPFSFAAASFDATYAYRSAAEDLAASHTPGLDIFASRRFGSLTAFTDFSCAANLQREQISDELEYERYFIADTAHPLVFYTDSAGSDIIANPESKYDFIRFQIEIVAAGNEQHVRATIPFGVVTPGARIGLRRALRPDVYIKGIISWAGEFYAGEHVWHTYDGPQYPETIVRIAHSRADGNDYLLLRLNEYDRAVCAGPVNIITHRQRRIDNTISANLFFEYDAGLLTDLSAAFYFARTFTTLDKTAPVISVPWNTGFFIVFKFSRKSTL
jgi:hypothetical protein